MSLWRVARPGARARAETSNEQGIKCLLETHDESSDIADDPEGSQRSSARTTAAGSLYGKQMKMYEPSYPARVHRILVLIGVLARSKCGSSILVCSESKRRRPRLPPLVRTCKPHGDQSCPASRRTGVCAQCRERFKRVDLVQSCAVTIMSSTRWIAPNAPRARRTAADGPLVGVQCLRQQSCRQPPSLLQCHLPRFFSLHWTAAG